MGEVPYQALPLLRFFAYKIRALEKVRKGEGEPGDEAALVLVFSLGARPSTGREGLVHFVSRTCSSRPTGTLGR